MRRISQISIYISALVGLLSATSTAMAQGIDMDKQIEEARKHEQKTYNDTDADRHGTLHAWYLFPRTGDMRQAPIDTMKLNSFHRGHIEGLSVAEAYTSTFASAYQSKIYFDRPADYWGQFFMSNPYLHLMRLGPKARFFDTKVPYSYLAYHSTGVSDTQEQNFSALFSTNLGPNLNLGGEIDIDHAGGVYNSTATHNNTYRIFASYTKGRYEAQAHVWNTNVVNQEGGGITDMDFIENPGAFVEGRRALQPKDIPTKYKNTWNRVNHGSARLNHRYRFGFYRYVDKEGKEVEAPKKKAKNQKKSDATPQDSILATPPAPTDSLSTDSLSMDSTGTALRPNPAPQRPAPKRRTGKSIGQEAPPDYSEGEQKEDETRKFFVPVTSIFHDIEYHKSGRTFISQDPTLLEEYPTPVIPRLPETRYYPNDYLYTEKLSNTIGLEMIEGFHKWAKLGLAAFVSLDYNHYFQPLAAEEDARRLSIEREVIEHKEHTTYVGGRVSSDSLSFLKYYIWGQVGVEGAQAGEVDLRGDITTYLKLWGKDVQVNAHARMLNAVPTYFLRHYKASLRSWDQDLKMSQSLSVGGELRIPFTGTRVYADFETIQNPIFVGSSAQPEQKSSNFRAMAVGLEQKLSWRFLNWENNIVWQNSSDPEVAPLPMLSLYSNFYIHTKVAKVMTLQIGMDAKWHTAYNAPYYEPTTQFFKPQTEVTVGGKAPMLTAYVNAHLKRMRFYLKYYNVGAYVFKPSHFSMPYYPQYSPRLMLGLAWDLRN